MSSLTVSYYPTVASRHSEIFHPALLQKILLDNLVAVIIIESVIYGIHNENLMKDPFITKYYIVHYREQGWQHS